MYAYYDMACFQNVLERGGVSEGVACKIGLKLQMNVTFRFIGV